MKNIFLKTLFATLILSGVNTFAHEGHNEVPGQIKSIHGGIVKAGKELNLEMVATDSAVQFFPLAHPGDKLVIADVKISGTAKTPKGKPQNLKFTGDEKSFSTTVDLEGSYRANLEIKVQYTGKTDTFKFIVEK